ncbi:MAG: ion transporter [Rhodospirillaceae bacterium]
MADISSIEAAAPSWREKCWRIVFRHDTVAGKAFDISLIGAIALSVLIAMLDSVATIHAAYGETLYVLEWAFTFLFTVEYLFRLTIVKAPVRYATSFYGVIDILAFLPSYIGLFVPGAQFMIVLRVLRVLRIFKILHMDRYVEESSILVAALMRSGRKILVFLLTITTVVTVFGALMYLVEGPQSGFTSIPMSMYWAVVTVGTVGYGDISPATSLGRFITAALILIGYGIIAVPTGIYAAELFGATRAGRDARTCPACETPGHDADARFCRRCGNALPGLGTSPSAGP